MKKRKIKRENWRQGKKESGREREKKRKEGADCSHNIKQRAAPDIRLVRKRNIKERI